ncbi:MAG TPA: type II CAAX endopeptidase family protein [Nitrospiraceae bacterium]|nr:type II CAAX endopeptidase family protein [Nitrospiraceae bacterium]
METSSSVRLPIPSSESTGSTGSLSPEAHVSTVVTLLMALVLVGGMGFFIWLQVSIPRVDRVGFPERALSHLMSRTLDMDEAIAQAPVWERSLYQLTADNGSSDLREAIMWYRELAAVSYNPDLYLQLAILEGEAGQLEDVSRQIKEWDNREDPFPLFARMIQAAYVDPRVDPVIARSLQAELADTLPAGWFYDKIALRLAERSSDRELVAAITAESVARVMPLLQKVRLLTAGELIIVLLGVPALLILLRRHGARYTVGSAAIPPVWRGRLGVAVLVRGGAMGLLLSVAFLFLEADSPLIRLSSIPLAGLPLFVLTRRYLLAPRGVGFMTGFGLRVVSNSQGRLVTAVFAVLTAGLIGEWALGLAAETWQVSSHWTEWFDADLVWGGTPVIVMSLLEFIVLAPLFEELVFRGLVFGTLRRRFNWMASAGISAGIFAIAHGYGVLGFISVFWSGLLWAWIYEKTGSLLPSMLAHAANNLLVCLSILYFFRS